MGPVYFRPRRLRGDAHVRVEHLAVVSHFARQHRSRRRRRQSSKMPTWTRPPHGRMCRRRDCKAFDQQYKFSQRCDALQHSITTRG